MQISLLSENIAHKVGKHKKMVRFREKARNKGRDTISRKKVMLDHVPSVRHRTQSEQSKSNLYEDSHP